MYGGVQAFAEAFTRSFRHKSISKQAADMIKSHKFALFTAIIHAAINSHWSTRRWRRIDWQSRAARRAREEDVSIKPRAHYTPFISICGGIFSGRRDAECM